MDEPTVHWNDLPKKVLTQIFDYVNADDLIKAVSITCKSWFEASAQPKFLSRYTVFIYNAQRRATEIRSTKIASSMKLFASSTRNFSSFYCHDVKLDGKNGEAMWSRIGGHITHFHCSNCQITSKALVNFLKNSPQLTSLAFYKMDGMHPNKWLASDFEELNNATNITHLRWDDDLPIKNNAFKALIGITKPTTLESLSLGNVRAIDVASKLQSLFGFGVEFNDERLTKESFEEFLERHYQGLKSLEIVDAISESIIKALVRTKLPLALEKLELRKFGNKLCAIELTIFLDQLKNLKELYLGDVTADHDTMEVIAQMKELECLTIEQKTSVLMNDTTIQLLHRFEHLKSLTLKNFEKVTAIGFNSGMQKIRLEQLHTLELERFPKIRFDCFIKIMPRLSNLKTLSIISCGKALTDSVLHLIFQHLMKLEKLNLREMKKITKSGFVDGEFGLANLRNLKELKIYNCSKLTDECLKSALELLQLKTVSFEFCPLVTAAGVKAFISNCPALRSLRVVSESIKEAEVADLKEYAQANMKRLSEFECNNANPYYIGNL